MKPMFYFLLALTAVLAATADPGDSIRDSDGDIVSDGSYYLNIAYLNGGVVLKPRDDNQCPPYIGTVDSYGKSGIPIRISNWGSGVGHPTESENLNIEMDIKPTTCAQSTYWWVTEAESDTGKSLIAAGPKPETDKDSSKSFFQLKKAFYHRHYNIMFCPNGNDCIGLVSENDFLRLAPGHVSVHSFLQFRFEKATGTKTSTKTMSTI